MRDQRWAQRVREIEPFHVMAVLDRARALQESGCDVIHMEIGEPDFSTPEPIMHAARAALNTGHTGYTPALGLPALREAVAGFYQQRYAIDLDPQRVVITGRLRRAVAGQCLAGGCGQAGVDGGSGLSLQSAFSAVG